ncbi:MAG: CidA/LrgA family protein [Clostridia bacterium]|nr:CidA/LrgA family protein [Clostridia bacterium]
MKLFRQIIRVFLICCIGDLVSMVLPFPFPGSVLALIFLFLCFVTKIIKPEQVSIICNFLLKNMTFVFLPSTVSIISYVDVLTPVIWKFLFICIITTVITFFCTAYSVKLTIFLMNKFRGGNVNAE